MRTGTIKFFNETKGFGFVRDSDTGEDFFFHVSALGDSVRERDSVTFDTQQSRKGINAINVKLA